MRKTASAPARALLSVTAARADDSFRCGRWILAMPVTVAELLQQCGAPTSKSAATADVRATAGHGRSPNTGTATTGVWRHGRGAGAAAMRVTVTDGEVESLARAP